ncbi:MAG: Tex family protein [Halanaerobiaceae bacterium]
MDKESLINDIANGLGMPVKQVRNTVKLLDNDNTVPFIARYRKEMTGNLDEEEIREIKERLEYLCRLEKRKEEVIRLIDKQNKLTAEVEKKIKGSSLLQEVEDLYRPYKQRKRTRAAKARDKGLEPLAELIYKQRNISCKLEEVARDYLAPNEDINTVGEALAGAGDIIAEWISDSPEIRKTVRKLTFEEGKLESNQREEIQDQAKKYQMYYDFSEQVKNIPPHRILALNRGEKEEVLRVKVVAPEEKIINFIKQKIIDKDVFCDLLQEVIKDSYNRLIAPSIAREIRNKLTEKAEDHALEVFGQNLRSILLQPPLKDKVIMGIDPGFRTGCKVCVIDRTGKLLKTLAIYPHPPQGKKKEAEEIINNLIEELDIEAIAIGNGTACRETEYFISRIIRSREELKYTIVSEAGASVYSASEVARREFPELDVSIRGAVSIARRLQDPMAELVKIDPESIGVGLYQHDVDSKKLGESLTGVVESAVNYVGVDLNTASARLLEYVSGINSRVAEKIVEKRDERGEFKEREELKNVYGVGPKTYKLAAGFVRIFSRRDPLARTPIHPESYAETEKLIRGLGYDVQALTDEKMVSELRSKLREVDIEEKSCKLGLGVATLTDIVRALKRPGRDPRQGLPGPVFRSDVLKMEDLEEGMVLPGTVRNVVDFGAFVDIGVKKDGLVHISELSQDYVEDPLEIVRAGDVIEVEILNVEIQRGRISLRMK